MKKKISKFLTLILAVLVVITAFPVSAALNLGSTYSYTERYLNAYYTTGEWKTADGHIHNNYGQVALRNLKTTGEPLYCIQIYNGCTGADATTANIESTDLWRKEFTDIAQNGITRVSIYGYPNYTYGYSADNAQLATQVLLWEFEMSKRTQFADTNTTGFAESIFTNYPDAKKCYQEIIRACANHQARPSFSNQTVELKGIGSAYSVTLTDSDNVLSNFTLESSNPRIMTSVSGNKLTVYATGSGALEGTLIFTKKNTDIDTAFALTGANQTLFYGTISDPVSTELNIKLSTGNLKIVKASEDGKKQFQFHIKGDELDRTVTTDAQTGTAELNNIPIGSYTVTEISQTPYVENKAQTKTVEAGATVTFDFYNTLKKFRVSAVKEDVETGTAQGDATLQGAEYGLYQNTTLVNTYITDENGGFTTDYEICGSGWMLKELKPSEGYLLDETEYPLPAQPENYTIELNTINKTVQETPVKGKIAIIKHSNTDDQQIDTPEPGAEFQVYLKSKGTYENAAAYERDVIVTDETGFAETKSLPYGVYTVHQTKGLDGAALVQDFDVYIKNDGDIYRYLLNNRPFTSYIKIAKVDIETNKQITASSAGYQLYAPDGSPITMRMTYPTPIIIDTFYTNSEGYLITPESLPYGKGYKLVEVQAPYGYILDSSPIEFDISQENSTQESAVTVVSVVQKNSAQQGVIEINKTGEQFATVHNTENMYTPVYEKQALPDAEFEIYAAEDIITGDGTIRAEKGTLVDTIKADVSGTAKSQPLYLGQYIVKEVKAPYAFTLDESEYMAVLSYAGQEVDCTVTALSLHNSRQTVHTSLRKYLEQDRLYMNGEMEKVTFGVYSKDQITAQDGSEIPADGLIASAGCDREGNVTFDCDLPIGFNWYVQEIATDEHYILSDEKYDFSTEYQGQEIKTIDIRINDGNEIVNALKRGSIQGMKKDDEGNALAGAVIGLFADGTTQFTEAAALETSVSAGDGTFSFLNIPAGNYIVKEITAPADYLIDPNSYAVTVAENEQIVTLEIVNVLKRGSIQGMKKDDKGNALAGAVIGLFADGTTQFTEAAALETSVSAEDGTFSFLNIPVGKYIVKELAAPDGYTLNDKEFKVSITENNQLVRLEIVNVLKPLLSPLTGTENKPSYDLVLCFSGAMFALLTLTAKKITKKEKYPVKSLKNIF